MNNYLEKVKKFHELFNHPVLNKPTIPKERVALRLSLLKEELQELEEACNNDNIVEVLDAFCDIQYVLSGAILEFGMKDIFDEGFEEVQRSNMSKTCKTKEEAEETIKYYYERDRTISEYKKIDGKYIVYRTNDDKTLKSINYSPADLKTMLNQ